MPFTPAHVSIVLPFLKYDKRYVSATGLIIGSMAPDFEYFLRMNVEGTMGHTFWGLLYFDVPVAIFFAFVFHKIVRHNLIVNLPAFLQLRFKSLLQFNFPQYFRRYFYVFIISAWLGALSHVFWDSFTHFNGYFVRHIPFMKTLFVKFSGTRYPIWFILQHVSTIIGLLILSLYVYSISPQPSDVSTKPSLLYWILMIGIASAVVFIRFTVRSSDYGLGNVIVTCISGIGVALIVCGLVRFNHRVSS
jgi:hypothetical protein